MWLPDAHLCCLILNTTRPCVAVLLNGAATSSIISSQMHQQNPADAPPESRGTFRIRRIPTESCLHLQHVYVGLEICHLCAWHLAILGHRQAQCWLYKTTYSLLGYDWFRIFWRPATENKRLSINLTALSSPVAPQGVVMTTFGTTSDDKVVRLTIFCFQWLPQLDIISDMNQWDLLPRGTIIRSSNWQVAQW